MIKRILRLQNGFAIVQGLMLAAAVAGMAYVGTKMITDQKMAEKGVESKSKLEQLHATIYSILQNQENCLATLTDPSNSLPTGLGGWGEFSHINTAGNTTPIFVSQGSDSSKFYMGRSIVINSMALQYTSYPIVKSAILRIEYAKLEDENVNRRTGRGYGSKGMTKNIQITATPNGTNGIKSCYAVNVGENENLVKDFCNELGADTNAATTGDTLFNWDSNYNRCVIKDLKCPSGQVFAGWDSNGARRCHEIKDWMNLGNVLDTSSVSCPKNSTNVKFVILSNGKAQIQCSGSVTACTSSCDCPGMTDVCLSNICVSQPTSCTPGAYGRGDAICRIRCDASGSWSCPATPAPICGTPNIDCLGNWSTCVASSQYFTVTQAKSGTGTACTNVTGDTRACTSSCTPVNGGWSAWGSYGACSAGLKWKYRSCNSPAKSCGGLNCVGSSSMSTSTGCTGCFVAGTEVEMSDGSAKNIEDVLLGEKLRDGESKIVNVKKLLVSDYWGDVHSINGGPYFFTPNHPFMTLDGWKSLAPEATKKESPGLKVSQLKEGDILVKKTGLEMILSIDAKVTEEKVYNFELDGTHSYMADEYKVHNKCAPMACLSGTHWYSCDPTNCAGSCEPDGQPNPHCP